MWLGPCSGCLPYSVLGCHSLATAAVLCAMLAPRISFSRPVPPRSFPLQAGTVEPLLERLPGAPDGVSTAADGSFWVALVSPIPPIAKLLRDPTVRALYAWLPDWVRPPVKKWGAVAKVSA